MTQLNPLCQLIHCQKSYSVAVLPEDTDIKSL
jgi:hypothetical protein